MKITIAALALVAGTSACLAQGSPNYVFTVQGTASPWNDNAYGINESVTLAPTSSDTFAFGQYNHVMLSGSSALNSFVGLNMGLTLGPNWKGTCCGSGFAAMDYEVGDLVNASGIAPTALPPNFYEVNELPFGGAYSNLNCASRCTYGLRQLTLGGSPAVSGPNEKLSLMGMHIDTPTGNNSGYETWYAIDISEANTNCELTFNSCYAIHETSTAKNLFAGATTFASSVMIKSSLFVSSPPSQTGSALCWNASSGQVTVDSTGCLASLGKFKNVKSRIGGEALADVMAMKPVWYSWNQKTHPSTDTHVQPGLIAEDVQKVDSRLSAYDGKGNLEGVRYAQLTALLVAAVQNQQAEIDTLKAQIGRMKAQTMRAAIRRREQRKS